MDAITITKPGDWHLHLRDKDLLSAVIFSSSNHFQSALVMPNLSPPITTVEMAEEYRNRICLANKMAVDKFKLANSGENINGSENFYPYMTLYLNSEMSFQELKRVTSAPNVMALKFYPAGATTNSNFGASEFSSYYNIFEQMEKLDIVLCVHGESVNPSIDVFDREARFVEESFEPMVKRFPNLRVVFEHISTSAAVSFVNDQSKNIVASVTPQHLAYNRNHLLAGKLRPHKYCAPLLKQESDRSSLVRAVTADSNTKFFLGTDSAPHIRGEKESSCGCAGCFSAPYALAKYAEIFSNEGKLKNLEKFSSFNGAKFYGLPINKEKLTLVRRNSVPTQRFITKKREQIIPFVDGELLKWQVIN